jgi:gentisate 1,2-dioxygenase
MKTAIEWLVEQMTQGDFIALPKPEWINQAKEMEKDNVCDAWDDGYDKGMRDRIEKISNPVGNAEQYYNETFKTQTIVTEFRDGSIKVETFKSE